MKLQHLVFNEWEKQLYTITEANWNTQYLTCEARIKTRSSVLNYQIFGIKVGSLLGRLCKMLHIDNYIFLRKLFICSDLPEASEIIKKTITLITDHSNEINSKLKADEREFLIKKVAKTFNDLVDQINKKRPSDQLLDESIKITIASPEKIDEVPQKKPCEEKKEAVSDLTGRKKRQGKPKGDSLPTRSSTRLAGKLSQKNK